MVMTVTFNEPLHHVCLIYGLRETFRKLPFLNRKVREIRGSVIVTDNPLAPPPVMKNPNRKSTMADRRNLVNVSYWRETLTIEYNEEICCSGEINAFAETLISDYLHFRHPFIRTEFQDGKCQETMTGHKIAEIS